MSLSVADQVQCLCAAVLCAVAAHRVLCRNTRMKNRLAAVRLPNISHLADFVINNGLSGIDLAVLIEITVNNNVRCNEVIISECSSNCAFCVVSAFK